MKPRLPDLLTLKNSKSDYSIEEAFESKLQGYQINSDLDLKLLKGIFKQNEPSKTKSMYAQRKPQHLVKPQLSHLQDDDSDQF